MSTHDTFIYAVWYVTANMANLLFYFKISYFNYLEFFSSF